MPFLSNLDLREYRPNEWVLIADLCYRGTPLKRIEVPRGFITDLASIPQAFRNVFNVNGRSRKAAVLHDYLYCTQGLHGALTRELCDAVFLDALADCGVDLVQRRLMWAGVRAGGWVYWRKRADGLRIEYDFAPAGWLEDSACRV